MSKVWYKIFRQVEVAVGWAEFSDNFLPRHTSHFLLGKPEAFPRRKWVFIGVSSQLGVPETRDPSGCLSSLPYLYIMLSLWRKINMDACILSLPRFHDHKVRCKWTGRALPLTQVSLYHDSSKSKSTLLPPLLYPVQHIDEMTRLRLYHNQIWEE